MKTFKKVRLTAGWLAVMVCQFAAGMNCRAGNTVIAWGRDDIMQTNVPGSLTNAVQVAGGWNHSFALLTDGTLAGWGTIRHSNSIFHLI